MICRKCGKEANDAAKHCDYCGAKLVTEQQAKAKKENGKFFVGLVIGIAAMVAAAVILYVTGAVQFTGKDDDAESHCDKIECSGFSSPENAVAEYLDALKNKDLNRMISCFAIESYAENFDFKASIEDMKIFAPLHSGYQWPDVGSFSRKMNVTKRESNVMSYITNQYVKLCTNGIPESNAGAFRLNDYSDFDDFLSSFVPDKAETRLTKLTFNNEFESWNHLVGNMKKAEYTKNCERRLYSDGAVVEPVFAVFYINDSRYILAIDTVKYNGRWFLYSPCMAVSDQNAYYGGIIEQ